MNVQQLVELSSEKCFNQLVLRTSLSKFSYSKCSVRTKVGLSKEKYLNFFGRVTILVGICLAPLWVPVSRVFCEFEYLVDVVVLDIFSLDDGFAQVCASVSDRCNAGGSNVFCCLFFSTVFTVWVRFQAHQKSATSQVCMSSGYF